MPLALHIAAILLLRIESSLQVTREPISVLVSRYNPLRAQPCGAERMQSQYRQTPHILPFQIVHYDVFLFTLVPARALHRLSPISYLIDFLRSVAPLRSVILHLEGELLLDIAFSLQRGTKDARASAL